MDRPLPPPRRRLPPAARWSLGLLVALGLGVAAWPLRERLPTVRQAQLSAVVAGEFRDELPLRAVVEPLRSVQLDAQEAGRVEAVLVHDGDTVAEGTPLFRLHSPEQEQLLMQRSAEVAQQLANVSVQRSALASSLAQSRRELAQLQAAQQQAEAEHARQAALAAEGFVAPAALEHSRRQLALASTLLTQTRQDQQIEAQTRQQSLDEMARAVQGLQRGLQLLERSRERLQQRAPMAGRLSGFTPQVGASVRPGERLGRIDDPDGGTQLLAEVDEYYLPRLQTGLAATSAQGPLALTQTLPQVQGGKARVRLQWQAQTPPLRPGQAVELRLQFSAPRAALMLPDGPGVQPQLYVREGDRLVRRSVQLGQRAAGLVEVLHGLQAGDEVLVSAPPNFDSSTLRLPGSP